MKNRTQSLLLAVTSVVAFNPFIPSWAITIGNLVGEVNPPATNIIVNDGTNNLYELSNFIAQEGEGDRTQLLALQVGTSLIPLTEEPNWNLRVTFGSATITTPGLYTITYALNYIGPNPPEHFFEYDQCFTGCTTNSTTTRIFDNSNFSGDPISQMTNANGGPLDISKEGSGLSTVYVQTQINVTSGSYGGFDQEFNAEPVPFESDVLPLVGATLLFGGGMWWKRRRAAASQLDLTQPGPEQEPGQE